MTQNSYVREFLKSFDCKSALFPSTNDILTIKNTAKLPDALQVLTKHHVLSLPVVDEEGRVTHVLSLLDAMGHIISQLNVKNVERMEKHTFDYFSVSISQKIMEQEQTKEIHELGTLDPALIVHEDTNLYDATQLMLKNHAHRVVVVSKDSNRLVKLITQSAIVKLFSMIDHQIPKLHQPVSSLKLGSPKEVAAVKDTDKAIEAFNLMKMKKISAVAVVDKDQVLVGNISASDITLLGNNLEFFNLLGEPAATYLHAFDSKKEFPRLLIPVTCKGTDTLMSVMKKINYHDVHRVYVVNDSGQPTGVISLQDIIEELVE